MLPGFTSVYSDLVLVTLDFIGTVLNNPHTEWNNVSAVSFQDTFNQVITGKTKNKKHLNNF